MRTCCATWIDSGTLQPQIANKLREWLEVGLQEWDISRDAPYFGFEIPGAPGKYFYVWLDAPIGYMASHQQLLRAGGPGLRPLLATGIGGRAVPLHRQGHHQLPRPVLARHAALGRLRTPTAIYVHGFLTVNGTKMSKSRGTFIKASTYLEHLDAEYLRYYFAAKLSSAVDDIDLNLEDFVQRVNSDVVGKIVNIASRCAGFLRKGFDNTLTSDCAEPELVGEFLAAGEAIAELYEAARVQQGYPRDRRPGRSRQPVHRRKEALGAGQGGRREAEVHEVCSVGINLFRVLMTYLKPVLPAMAEKAEAFLQCSLDWTALEGP